MRGVKIFKIPFIFLGKKKIATILVLVVFKGICKNIYALNFGNFFF